MSAQLLRHERFAQHPPFLRRLNLSPFDEVQPGPRKRAILASQSGFEVAQNPPKGLSPRPEGGHQRGKGRDESGGAEEPGGVHVCPPVD